MILSRIYNKLNKNKREDLVCGLVGGLIFGLICGIVSGLIFGLAFGLAFGLVCGFVCGLIGGLTCGLVFGLVYGLVGGLVCGLFVILTNFTEALSFIQGALSIIGFLVVLFGLGISIILNVAYENLLKENNILEKEGEQ